ncbi:response regulator [Prosthecochloris sp. N3]|uniref:Response regulator n=1 Tax=Prosthecochloris ethylica TaxID=2743976 RepID=A0ABR9XSC3_9CHLB|nr:MULTISPECIES: response regulator [Prosthecochloris]MBF0586765.1 response regulator [Prosthecochloris ethylica]MBF0636671.1 response regulator [Prosthecochloris ethylica]NUK47930.1 response regulator [Prosthecochloris ethylica]RNA65232.1 response regulator [Prosthecochloris sp. ZM_2]
MNTRQRSILLVEDQPNTRRLISFTLKKAGYQVHEAENGRDALDLCRQAEPDLILCDVMMPVMDGFEFREHLLADKQLQHIPFIFLSARAQTHEVINAQQLLPLEYITKPAEPKHILKVVQSHLP